MTFEKGSANLLSKFGRSLVVFIYLCPKLTWFLAGILFLWPILYLDGWLPRSSYFIGGALYLCIHEVCNMFLSFCQERRVIL